jgi:hypothetical protein
MTEKEFRCSHELHKSIPTSCRDKDLNLHNSIPATAVEKKIACVFQFQQKWRRTKKNLRIQNQWWWRRKIICIIQFQHQRRKMTKLHNIIPATVERKINCIILFQQWQRRRQKFIIQFQQQQRKKKCCLGNGSLCCKCGNENIRRKRDQEGWQDREFMVCLQFWKSNAYFQIPSHAAYRHALSSIHSLILN